MPTLCGHSMQLLTQLIRPIQSSVKPGVTNTTGQTLSKSIVYNDSFHCFTLTSISTYCSLNIDILRDSCYATIDLNSIDTSGSEIIYCTKGNITIDKNLWKEGIMKAVFSFNFENKGNPKEPIYWKGKIYARMN